MEQAHDGGLEDVNRKLATEYSKDVTDGIAQMLNEARIGRDQAPLVAIGCATYSQVATLEWAVDHEARPLTEDISELAARILTSATAELAGLSAERSAFFIPVVLLEAARISLATLSTIEGR